MCNSPSRNGRLVSKPISDHAAWGRGSPRVDAAACVRIASRNGGVASMRALIAVSEKEKAELLALAADDPEFGERIERAIAFREAVLREFDRLSQRSPA